MSEQDGDVFKLLSILTEQAQETQTCLQKMDKKLDLHIQKQEYELANIHELDQEQNAMLNEHMRRTELAEERLTKLEEPRKAIGLLLKLLGGVTVLAGGFSALAKFFGLF